MIEWDEARAAINLAKHGLDFADARHIFDGRPLLSVHSDRTRETRYKTVAFLNNHAVTLIWTWRGKVRRVISMRRARDGERRSYRALHGE